MKRRAILLAASGLAGLIVLLSHDLPFYWDTIQLGARQASHWYRGGGWLLPDAIDSGHPPAFGAYLAVWWHLLGRELWVSHLTMLPWIALLLYQLLELGRRAGSDGLEGWVICVPLLDPVLLGQLLLVSPDIVLVAAYLTGLRTILAQRPNRRLHLFVVVLVLALVSTRGWMAALSLYLLQIGLAIGRKGDRSSLLKDIVAYLPGGLLALAFLLAHYHAKGWIGFHPESPWAGSFTAVGPAGIARNVGLIGWRLLDVGRFVGWFILGYALIRHNWRRFWQDPYWRGVAFATVAFLLVFTPFAIGRTGLTGPRYLLPAILALNLLALRTLKLLPNENIARGLAAIFGVSLLIGNFWQYPQRIAQAWDATPAHVAVHGQLRAAVRWLDAQDIPLDLVGSVFPDIGPQDWRELNGRQTGFRPADLATDRYVFVSKAHNDWSDAQLDRLDARENWIIVWEQKHPLGVWSRLYRRQGNYD